MILILDLETGDVEGQGLNHTADEDLDQIGNYETIILQLYYLVYLWLAVAPLDAC